MEAQKNSPQKQPVQSHVHQTIQTTTQINAINKNPSYEHWYKKNNYYHGLIQKFYQFVIPENSTVLQIGSKHGHLLNAVKPSLGIGIESDADLIATAQANYPNLHFYHGGLSDFSLNVTFDYIILSCSVMEMYDIQDFLTQLRPYCTPSTRIVIDSYSYLWEPVLWVAQKLKLRRPTPYKNWVSRADIQHFLQLSGFETVTKGEQILLPINIPLIAWFFNTFIPHIPIVRRLCLSQWIVARPQPVYRNANDYSVSVIIPCRNEKGNVEPAILQTPTMGKSTEFIFVEGNSADGTYEEMERVAAKYPEKNIKVFKQEGKGKGAAVRKGFEVATGDVLIILDGDITTPPEEMPKFFDALITGKGEFINGSRMVYGMESEAMRFARLVANYGISMCFTWLLGQKVKDTLCGTKVLFKKDYEKIAANRAYFGDFDPFGDFDLLFGAAKQNLKIVDMPVHYKNRSYGTTQINPLYHVWFLWAMGLVGIRKFKFR